MIQEDDYKRTHYLNANLPSDKSETYTHSNLFDVMSVGMIITNSDQRIIQANSRALKDMKLTDEDVANRQISDLIGVYCGQQNILPESLAKLSEGASTVEFTQQTYIKVSSNSEKFYITGEALSEYHQGSLSRIHFLFRNIENELTQEYILHMSLKHTKIFPWFFNMERNRMIIDERWFIHLGLEKGDCSLSSEEFAALLHPDDRDKLMKNLAEHLAGNHKSESFSYRLHRNDGTWEWFEEIATYMGQTGNTPYRVVGVCQSIQEYKDVEATLIAARNKAQESDRLKSGFLANMSHEIRTPLNAIVGFSNLLTSNETAINEEESKEFARLINVNSDQLLMLISDILDLSKIESNTMEFNYREQSLNGLLEDIYKAQQLNMPEGIEFTLNLPDTDTLINTDPMRLKQVINNLINNSIKFTDKGNITFGYEVDANNKFVRLYVNDTGAGIPADKLAHIFERFYKANTFIKGAGLGLPISKTIIENLGGTISCTSEINKGTCFSICHPLSGKTYK